MFEELDLFAYPQPVAPPAPAAPAPTQRRPLTDEEMLRRLEEQELNASYISAEEFLLNKNYMTPMKIMYMSKQCRWLMSRTPEQLVFRALMRQRHTYQRRVRRLKRKLKLLVNQ